jgi:hypothetical protein
MSPLLAGLPTLICTEMLACDRSTPEDCSAWVREFSILFNTKNNSVTAYVIPFIRTTNYSSSCPKCHENTKLQINRGIKNKALSKITMVYPLGIKPTI